MDDNVSLFLREVVKERKRNTLQGGAGKHLSHLAWQGEKGDSQEFEITVNKYRLYDTVVSTLPWESQPVRQ